MKNIDHDRLRNTMINYTEISPMVKKFKFVNHLVPSFVVESYVEEMCN